MEICALTEQESDLKARDRKKHRGMVWPCVTFFSVTSIQIFGPKFYLNNYKFFEQELPILHPIFLKYAYGSNCSL